MAGQLNLFAGKRQRGRSPKHKLEFSTHVAVADVLRRWQTPGWRWSHFPAGEWRHPGTAARLKRMGLQPAWPDFLLLAPAPHVGEGLHCLELKREGGTLTDWQQAFADFCLLNGYPYAWHTNFRDAVTQLKAWGAVRASVSV